MTTQRFQVVFEAHTARFRNALRGVRRDVEGFARRVGRLAVRGGLLGTALGGGALALGGIAAGRTIDKLSNFTALANRLRTQPAVIQVLDRLARVRGVELDQLVETIEELQRTIGEGKWDLFEQMGLDPDRIREVQNNALKLFALFADRLGELSLADAIAAGGPIVGEDVTRSLIGLRRPDAEPRDRWLNKPGSGSVEAAVLRAQRQIGNVGGLLGVDVRQVERLRENWIRITDLVEIYALKLAEKAAPNLARIATVAEAWVRSQGGLDAIAARTVTHFADMLGRVEDIIAKVHEMVSAVDRFRESLSFGSTMAGRMASDVGDFLGRNLGTAEGRQGMIDTVVGDLQRAAEAIERVAPRDLYTRLVDAIESLVNPAEETARNTRNPVARAQ